MERNVQWRELYRTNDPALAHTLATCIEGMEFDVRVRDTIGRLLGECHDETKARMAFKPPFVIDVHEEDWPALRDVLTELIEEQSEFDDKLEAQQQRSTRVAQLLVLSAVTLLASFVGASMLKQCEVDRP